MIRKTWLPVSLAATVARDHALLNMLLADFLPRFGAYLPFVHELSSDSPCRAPVPLRIAIAGL
jgi:hypothetical protein